METLSNKEMCEISGCSELPGFRVVAIEKWGVTSEKLYCHKHIAQQPLLSGFVNGRITAGATVPKSDVGTFEIRYIVFFGQHSVDSVYLEDKTRQSFFGLPIGKCMSGRIYSCAGGGDARNLSPYRFIKRIFECVGARPSNISISGVSAEDYDVTVTFRNQEQEWTAPIFVGDGLALSLMFKLPIVIHGDVYAQAAALGWVAPK